MRKAENTMKRTYIEPNICIMNVSAEPLLSASGVSSNKGIGYGGTDEGGWKDPDSRRLSNSGQWDDEEDF